MIDSRESKTKCNNWLLFFIRVLQVQIMVVACSANAFSQSLSEAPRKPTNVSVSSSGGGAILITWHRSIDADGVVTGYELIKNGTGIWLGDVSWYYDTSVSAGVTFSYTVVAVDNEGLRSSMSDTVTYRYANEDTGYVSGYSSAGGSISVSSDPGAAVTARVCIDSDGDGWGWDGEKSCKTGTPVISRTCLDEDGDGWGWDGEKSCYIENTETLCIDSDGDGYGWDGFKTCSP